MQISSFTSVRPTMSETRTYEDFSKFLGTNPKRLGIVSRLYEDCTASYLTESLKNIFYQDRKSNNKYQSLDSMYFDWEIETNNIKRVEFADNFNSPVTPGSEFVLAFKERYYEKYDIFQIDSTGQQCMVVARPIRKRDDYWEVTVRLIDNDYRTEFQSVYRGDTTRFIGNAVPELHEEGYVKYQSNVSKFRNYITTHRVDDSYSAQYAAFEDMWITIGKGNGDGKQSEVTYRMDKKEKNLLDNFMYVRNNMLLFSKTNVDKNGKVTICDPDTGRPIYIGEGVIPQVEKFASKYAFNTLTLEVFRTVIAMLVEKAEKPTGNNFTFIINERMWFLIQDTLADFLSHNNIDGSYMWSMKANDYIQVGATYNSYKYGGNTVTFVVDRTFSREFGFDKGYALCLDLTADKTNAQPPIAMFTLKGGDFITNKVLGVGGADGLSSGVVSSPVAGSKIINWGYSSVAVFNPYRSFILREI